jgi:hypothetical protein
LGVFLLGEQRKHLNLSAMDFKRGPLMNLEDIDAGMMSVPVVPKLSFTPEEAATATGFSKTRIFGAIRDQELTARKDGKATVIEASELLRWLRSRPTRGRQPQEAAA